MIPCEPCQCGGRRLVYRKRWGKRFVTRYLRCVDCGKTSKTIQSARSVAELLDTISHQWNRLVTADESKPDCLLQRRDET